MATGVEANLVFIPLAWTVGSQKQRAGTLPTARCSKERIVSGAVLAITRNNRPSALDTVIFIWRLYERLHRNNALNLERK